MCVRIWYALKVLFKNKNKNHSTRQRSFWSFPYVSLRLHVCNVDKKFQFLKENGWISYDYPIAYAIMIDKLIIC